MKRPRLRIVRSAGSVLAALLGAAAPAGASVVFVDADRPPGGDGAVWATAFDDLQDALDLALVDPSVEAVWVAEGTYRPDRGMGDRAATFRLISFVEVYGGFAGDERLLEERDPARHVTVLSGDLAGDDQPGFVNVAENSLHVIDARNASVGSVLDGFTVTGGNADGACCTADRGGGMIASFGATTLTRCTFHGNRAIFGGAIFYERQGPVVTDCLFDGNAAVEGGGAIYCRIGTPVLNGCTFTGNTARYGAGAVFDDGAPQLVACTFIDNTAQLGGAVFNFDGAATVALDCLFELNTAISLEESFAAGGAVSSIDSTPVYEGCTFSGNFAFSNSPSSPQIGEGGALDHHGCIVTIVDCIFHGNVAERGGAQMHHTGTVAMLDGCTFEGNLSLRDGGAINIDTTSQASLAGSVLSGNFAVLSGGGVFSRGGFTMTACMLEGNGAGMGGGFACAAGTMSISGTTFRGNAADYGGACRTTAAGVISGCLAEENSANIEGGGLWFGGAITVADTTIARNDCIAGAGGGIYARNAGLIERCAVAGNSGGLGGGVHFDGSGLTARSSVFVGNVAAEGGAFYLTGGSNKLIDGCTIASNLAQERGGGVFIESGFTMLQGSIFRGNASATASGEAAQIDRQSGVLAVHFCNVEGLTGGLGWQNDIDADPLFARLPDDGGDGWGVGDNDDYGDLHLMPGSPCIDRGSPAVAAQGESTDLDGEPRVIGCRVDIGADESASGSGDCNGNGAPDACDIEDGTSADCDGSGIPDECDIADGSAPDCNRNGVPDGCETVPPQVMLSSGALSPIGHEFPQTWMLPITAEAAGDVTLSFVAAASLHTFIEIDINGVVAGRIFEAGEPDCSVTAMDQLIVDAATFNAAVGGGPVVINMVASPPAHAQNCSMPTHITAEISYEAAAPSDLDGDGMIDSCGCPADNAAPPDGVVDVEDLVAVILAWGEVGGPCDVDGDGVVAVGDLLMVIVSWGRCP